MLSRRRWVALGVGALALGALMFGLRAPANPPPRDGRVLPGGVVVVWSPAYRVSFFGIERLHPFDITKLDRIAASLVDEGLLGSGDFAIPEAIDDERLAAVHDPAYLASLHDLPTLSRALEVPVPNVFPDSVVETRVRRPFRAMVGGTEVAVRAALAHGVGINLGGGFHHARPALGHGFCVYNDVAWALHVARAEGFTGRVLIFDTDAHQGDGDHAFFADDPSVLSVSMHGGHLFPSPKLEGDLDVELPRHVGDVRFLATLDATLEGVFEEAGELGLVIHVAGSDVLLDDPLADLDLTEDGLVERDLRVFRAVRGRGIPFVQVLAGGYGPRSAPAQARSVASVLREAAADVAR